MSAQSHLDHEKERPNACRICGGDLDGDIYRVKEMHFGTREAFEYARCSQCHCLQILEIPKNLDRYYPEKYYAKHVERKIRHFGLRILLRRAKLNAVLNDNRLLSSILFFVKDPSVPRWLAVSGLNSRTRILDVGSGAGRLLLKLRGKGFRELVGSDPLIDSPVPLSGGVEIHKKEVWELAEDPRQVGSFDVVMMHHSLEHMPDQHRVIKSARTLLKRGGVIVVRVPLSSSWAWENYRENWVQLDAPRHLYLHSVESIMTLARVHGLELRDQFHDSTEFQFTGSERYKRGIALNEGSDEELYSDAQIKEFRRRAYELNGEGRGDQACFVFSVTPASEGL